MEYITTTTKKHYDEAHSRFVEVCKYVTEHQESYDIVSKYELAKLDVENNYITIQPIGEYQDERDEAFEYIWDAIAKKLPDGNDGVIYSSMLSSTYEIVIIYQPEIVSRKEI